MTDGGRWRPGMEGGDSETRVHSSGALLQGRWGCWREEGFPAGKMQQAWLLAQPPGAGREQRWGGGGLGRFLLVASISSGK